MAAAAGAGAKTGAELYAASKFIGRECATINKDFFLCKKNAGADPAACESQSVLASLCANKVVDGLKADFAPEFTAFASCLDKNDYRFADCRKTQEALVSGWNAKYGLVAKDTA